MDEIDSSEEKKMNKEFYKSTTFWGCTLLFIGGGLESIGVTGSLEFVKQLALVLGLPMTAFGLRKAMK